MSSRVVEITNISYELRALLHHLLSYTSLGVSQAKTAPPEKLRHYYETIYQYGEMLMSQLQELPDLSKQETDHISLENGVTDFVAMERHMSVQEEGSCA